MLEIVWDILHSTWRHRRLLFATALLLRLASLALLWPLFGWLMRQLIATSGQDALTDQEIATFLLSPIGLTGAIGCLVVGVVILAMEQSSLLLQSFGLAQGYRVSIPAAILWSLRNLGSTALLCLAVIARTLLLLLPFLAGLGLVYWLLLGDVDINFYIDRRPPKFWLAVGLAMLVSLFAMIVIVPRLASWSLALPVLLVTDSSPLAALQTSRQLVGSFRWLVAIGWLAWALVNLLLSSLFASAVYGLARFSISSTTLWLPVLVPILGTFLIVWLVGTLLLSLFQGISFALLVSSLYRRFGWDGRHGTEVRQRLGADWLERFYCRELGASPVKRPAAGQALQLGESAEQLDRSSRRWLWIAAAIGLVAVGAGLWLLLGLNSREDALVFAHRGAAGLRPENSLAAFELACVDRADFVELDVQESADGEVIVFHDSDYMKIAGINLKAWNATQPELAEIDIGSRFSSDYRDQRTPLLRDALRLCKGRAKVDIELKYYGHNQRLVERVIEIVEQEQMVDQVVLMSLHPPFVAEAKRLRPTWTVGLLAAVGVGDLSKLEADFLAVNTRTATRDLIARAQARGKQVYVWTVDSPVLMSFYLGRGVDGIITNRPDLARQVIEQLQEMSPAERLLLDSSVRLGIIPAENKTDQSENGA
ncbi:MAG: glycerophosphodiester phosphodiesterase family protein [Planctomycetota bacterium]